GKRDPRVADAIVSEGSSPRTTPKKETPRLFQTAEGPVFNVVSIPGRWQGPSWGNAPGRHGPGTEDLTASGERARCNTRSAQVNVDTPRVEHDACQRGDFSKFAQTVEITAIGE
ncbi:MAG: hypothetical protein VCB42_02055, partial [Myxococcota bacterium]